MTSQNLYVSLTRFPLAASLMNRLRRENRWTPTYTAHAIAEYKRFVYLAVVSPNPVSPSEAVDKVWHTHLLYTRSYWQDLCANLLGRPLHHDPSTGGNSETAKFNSMYEATKALYRLEFSEEPPTDLWPPTAQRFEPARNWVIPQPVWWRRLQSVEAFPMVLPLLGFSVGLGPVLVLAALFAFIVAIPLLAQRGDEKRRRHAEGADISGIDFGGDSSDCGDSGGDCGDGGGGCGGGD